MTKGIIISGGWGTRLRPLTCTVPKSLMQIVNKPVIERQMMLLKSAGITEIVLAVSVMADVIKNYFGDGKKFGFTIHYTNEKHPLGTGGAVKLAESYLEDDNFFMLNGDVILNFDFSEMLRFHKRKKGIGTIASYEVKDPSRYGVLITDKNTNLLLEFLEKEEYHPPNGIPVPMPINAGVYILEPEIFSYIEPEKKISIERDVFSQISTENKLYHFPITGIWKDIGKPFDLLQGNILLMNDIIDNLNSKRQNLIDSSAEINLSTQILPPCTIGKNVVIRKECKIGPNVIIGDNVYIEDSVDINNSLIYNESYISKNSKIEKSIISDNCHLGPNVQLKGFNENPVIIASHVRILKDINLIADSNHSITFCHHEEVKESIKYPIH